MTKSVIIGILAVRMALPVPYVSSIAVTHASILGSLESFFTGPHVSADETAVSTASDLNTQKMPLLESPANPLALGSTSPTFSADANTTALLAIPSALLAESPAPQSATTSQPVSSVQDQSPSDQSGDEITTYTVKSGDTVSGIAKKFGISVNTVLWANNLRVNSTLKVGQTLTILPINGITYTIKSGDTLQAIALKYKGDIQEIRAYNNMSSDVLTVGNTIVIPDGEIGTSVSPTSSATKTTSSSLASKASAALGIKVANADTDTTTSSGYYMRPIKAGVRTQGIHGHNAVDLADVCGTPVYASAAGTVTLTKSDGQWNGGYGNYVVINHSNGSQTLYAHFSQVLTTEGATVTQGQEIGLMGETGEATGCHVHFEIRNGIANPF